MDFLWAAISGAFSGIEQGFLSLFGMSDAQKLGRLQVQEKQEQADLAAKEEEARVMEAPSRPESVVDDELRSHAK